MVNETFRMAKQAILDARNDVKSRCILFVRPSDQGKTHTAHIIARDLNAIIIPVMSTNEQRTWFSERLDNPIFIMDDPSDWYIQFDRTHLFSVLKNLVTGWLKSTRATKFDYNVPQPLDKKCCILMFSNEDQYSAIRKELAYIGLQARLEIYFTRHTKETMVSIKKFYKDNFFDSRNLPKFKDTGDNTFAEAFLASAERKSYYAEDIVFQDPEV